MQDHTAKVNTLHNHAAVVSPFQNCARKALDKFASFEYVFFLGCVPVLMLRPDGYR